MAKGFADAGVQFDMVVDWDADACASYEANLGHRPVRMDARDLLRMARLGWRPSEAIELFVADPPCTPWSRAGKRRGLADERDCLVVTVELIRLLRPRCYLIGNLPGLQDSTTWPIVQRVIGGLRADGYCVADYAVLDAAAYGVPQHRIRPFWYGHLDGPCLAWPAPTHGRDQRQKAIPGAELKPYVTCRQALRRLPVDQLGRPVRVGRGGLATHEDHNLSRPDAPAKTLTKNTHGDGSIVLSGGA